MSRLFLILALVIIPFVDWLVQFPSGSLVELPAHGLVDGRETHLYAVSAGGERYGLPDRDVTTGPVLGGPSAQTARSLVNVPLPTAPEGPVQPLWWQNSGVTATGGTTPPPEPTRAVSDRSGEATSEETDYRGIELDGRIHPGPGLGLPVQGAVHPRPTPTVGIATWYGGSLFNGKPTASGQPFNPWEMTAASNNYPLGTILEVEYRATITVTITDRGNFDHLLDLSQGAFHALVGSNDPGVIPVIVRPLDANAVWMYGEK